VTTSRCSCARARRGRAFQDRHIEGRFARSTWLRLLEQAGFVGHGATRPNDNGTGDEIFWALAQWVSAMAQ
jgi:hypothetical protein